MSNSRRYFPDWPLPEYIFVPGKNPHPKKLGGHMAGLPDPTTLPLDAARPEECVFLRYALDLYNFGYFWESHVYFEALWNAHGRTGPEAVFLKALIKLAAAGVKTMIGGQEEHAKDHYKRAQELILEVKLAEGSVFLGFNLENLEEQIARSLAGSLEKIVIHPVWK